MKLPKFAVRKKLRASTARPSLGGAAEMDYDEMSEPNMKLSRALLIVLVLHVVAVSGIIAFNTIKGRQGAFPAKVASATKAVEPLATAKSDALPTASPNPAAAPLAAKINPKDDSKIQRALPVKTEVGNFYTVAKGDNPVKIAKKLKVSERELLAVNHIDDPRKLQIGQKLIVPTKAKSKKD